MFDYVVKMRHVYQEKYLSDRDHKVKLTDDDMVRICNIAQVVTERYVMSPTDSSWSEDEYELYCIMEEIYEKAAGIL